MGRSKIFTDEQQEWIKDNRYGYGRVEFTNLLNKHFHSNFTESQVKNFCERNRIVSGISGRFQKGLIPHNKGIKGWNPKGCEKGWFKKGSVPKNTLPVGSETTDKDGYILVKVADPNEWKLKHRLIWEKEYRELKKGEVVIFIDGDKTNFNVENLRVVTRGELAVLNNLKRIQYNNAELNQAGLTITRIEMAIKKKNEDNKK